MSKAKKGITVRSIQAALAALGATPAAVSASLGRRRISGDVGSAYACPVAVYLTRTLHATYVSVGLERVIVDWVCADSTRAVQGFIRDFDSGLFLARMFPARRA